jgi:hypothetical protein
VSVVDRGKADAEYVAALAHLTDGNLLDGVTALQRALSYDPDHVDAKKQYQIACSQLQERGLTLPAQNIVKPVRSLEGTEEKRLFEALATLLPDVDSGTHYIERDRPVPVHTIAGQSSRIDALYSPKMAAEFLGITKYRLDKLEKEGRLVPTRTKPGGERRYTGRELKRMKEELERESLGTGPKHSTETPMTRGKSNGD